MSPLARENHRLEAGRRGLQAFGNRPSPLTGERYPLCLDDSDGRQCTGLVYCNYQCFMHWQGWSRDDVIEG